MTWQENFFSNLLTVTILVLLVLIVYLKATNRTLIDFIRDIRDALGSGGEKIQESVQGGFDKIV